MPDMPPELMNLVAGGAGKSAAPPAPGAPAGIPGMPGAAGAGAPGGAMPVSAPMSTPQPKAGDKQNALINVSLAMDLLEQSLPALGSESEEGQTILDVLRKMSGKFGAARNKSQDLVPAELMQLMQNLPQAGGASPMQKALQQPAGPKPPGAM
jgi:hypothetical protein